MCTFCHSQLHLNVNPFDTHTHKHKGTGDPELCGMVSLSSHCCVAVQRVETSYNAESCQSHGMEQGGHQEAIFSTGS